jgi:hypothetical protein
VLPSGALSLVVVPSSCICASNAGSEPRPMATATEEQRLARVGSTARRCEKPQLDKGFQGNDNAYCPSLRGDKAHCRSLDGHPCHPTAPVDLLLPGLDEASSPCCHAWQEVFFSKMYDLSHAWPTPTPVVVGSVCGHAVLATCQYSKEHRRLLPAGRLPLRQRTPNSLTGPLCLSQ